MMRVRGLVTVGLVASATSGCGYNQIQTKDEAVNKAKGQIEAQLQRRADLARDLRFGGIDLLGREGEGARGQRQLVELVGISENGFVAAQPDVVEDRGDGRADFLGNFAFRSEQSLELFGETGVAGVEPIDHQA